MIELAKRSLPYTVEVWGKLYKIKTDFRYYINLSRMIREKHQLEDFDIFYTDKIPYDRQTGLNELLKFAFPQQELPRNIEPSAEKALDYDIDGDLIYSAFFHYYNIDLAEVTLHWYKFVALLQGIKDTKLNDIMNIRTYKPTKNDGKEYKAEMLKLKAAWRIEEPLTEEEEKAVANFERLAAGKKV